MTIDELRAIAEAATPGPWHQGSAEVYGPEFDGHDGVIVRPGCAARRDLAHIATFNPDCILAMLDVIEAADDPAVYDVMSDTTMYPAHKRLAAALARLKEMER